jgi:S-adenosylmethionine:diacylglycerol 3-amino-3-carboxypropyl transferase
VRERELRAFLALEDLGEQSRVWRERILTRRLRIFLRLALHPCALRLLYPRDLVGALPGRFDRAVLARFERTWSRHPNRDNRWAWRLLLDEEPPTRATDPSPAAREGLEFRHADAEAYLGACAPATFDGISLSNVLDAMPESRGASLLAAASRAAKPGARIVIRRFAEPRHGSAAGWAARDRSPLWGAIDVFEVRGDGSCATVAP